MELRTDRLKLAEVFPDAAKAWAKRLHIKADAIDYVRKGIPIDPKDISIEEGERAAIRYVSTPRLDRDGEILLPDGAVLETFRDAPTVLYAHDYSGLPVGRDAWLKVTKRGILVKTIYANHQLAQDVYDCVKDGFLTSSSVGFIPVEWIEQSDRRFSQTVDRLEKEYGVPRTEAESAKRVYTKWVLLEHSDVPVPSNASCLNVLVGKSISARLKADMGLQVDMAETADPQTKDALVADEKAVEGEPTYENGPKHKAVVDMAAEVVAESIAATGAILDEAEAREPEAPAVPDASDPVPESKAEGQPIDATLQLLTAILAAVQPLAAEIMAVRAELSALKTEIPLLIVPAKPEDEDGDEDGDDGPAGEGDETGVLQSLLLLTERVDSIKQSVDALKPAAPTTVPEPVPAPAPAPEPEKAVDLNAAVRDALQSIDIKAVIAEQTTLALSRLRGKVVG